MLNKKIIIFSIFLILLIGISSVSANENITEDISNINEDNIETISIENDNDLNTELIDDNEIASEITENALESDEDNVKLEEEPQTNHYGYWANSIDMYNINLTDFQKNGVTDIFKLLCLYQI